MLMRACLGAAFLGLALAARLVPGTALPWHAGLEPGLEEARREDALLVVQLGRPGLPLAERMEREVFAAPEVRRELAQGFVAARVDSAARPELFAELVGSAGALATCVLDARGRLVSAL